MVKNEVALEAAASPSRLSQQSLRARSYAQPRHGSGKGGECNNGKQNNDARDGNATALLKCAAQPGAKRKTTSIKSQNSLLEPDTLGQFHEIALALTAQPGI